LRFRRPLASCRASDEAGRGVIAISDGGCVAHHCQVERMSVITASTPRSSRQRGQATALSAVAILSASLAGLGLAYFAFTLLIPAAGRDESIWPLVSGDSRPQGAICSSGSSSVSPQAVRAEK
jgi:hypothetical protein